MQTQQSKMSPRKPQCSSTRTICQGMWGCLGNKASQEGKRQSLTIPSIHSTPSKRPRGVAVCLVCVQASRLALKRRREPLVRSQGSTMPLLAGTSCFQNGDNCSQKKRLIFISQQCNTITGIVWLWTADYHWNLVQHSMSDISIALCSF